MILSIGESHPKHWKPGAAIIKAVEGLDHTHSFVSWHDEILDIRKVGEARGGGGRIVANKQFRAENLVVRVFQYEISQEQAKALEIWMWGNLMPYGYKHMLGLGLLRLERLWNSKAQNRLKDGGFSMVCVELTARAIEAALKVDLAGDIEDYGLKEVHNINMQNLANKLCSLASDELVAQINAG